MSKEFIVETAQIAKAVELINAIETDRFMLLIQRILSKVHSATEHAFKPDELDKLEKSFSFTSENLTLVIDILEFIFLQAAYEIAKPAYLQSSLIKIKLSEEKANCIAELWKENAKEILEKIRQNKTISSQRLKSIKWRLHLNLATDYKTKQKTPTVLFDFNINNNQTNRDQTVQVELNKEQLFDFFTKLEQIQMQIDGLNG